MLGLPKECLVSKSLPKKSIYDLHKPSPAERRLFDEEISRLSIVAELSAQTLPMLTAEGEASIFVILVTLKVPNYHSKNIALLTKLIDQRMLFILKYESKAALAIVYDGRILLTESKALAEWTLELVGTNLDTIWEHFIAQIAGVKLKPGESLDQAITKRDYLLKLQKDIRSTERKLRRERQPRKKWDLNKKLKQLKAEYEGVLK